MRKPSRGDLLIKSINERKKEAEELAKLQQDDHIQNQNDEFVGTIKDGVEVVDVKAISKNQGIPNSDKRKTWDKL